MRSYGSAVGKRQRRVHVGQVGGKRVKEQRAHVREHHPEAAAAARRRREADVARTVRARAIRVVVLALLALEPRVEPALRLIEALRIFELGFERHEGFADERGERVEGARGGVLGGAIANLRHVRC